MTDVPSQTDTYFFEEEGEVSVRVSYVEAFGEDEALSIEAAADEHKNGVHDKAGSDAFRWAIAICLGFQCAEVDSYRESHSIKAPWSEIQQWIKNHGDLENHDGDVDFIMLAVGGYDEYVPERNND